MDEEVVVEGREGEMSFPSVLQEPTVKLMGSGRGVKGSTAAGKKGPSGKGGMQEEKGKNSASYKVAKTQLLTKWRTI